MSQAVSSSSLSPSPSMKTLASAEKSPLLKRIDATYQSLQQPFPENFSVADWQGRLAQINELTHLLQHAQELLLLQPKFDDSAHQQVDHFQKMVNYLLSAKKVMKILLYEKNLFPANKTNDLKSKLKATSEGIKKIGSKLSEFERSMIRKENHLTLLKLNRALLSKEWTPHKIEPREMFELANWLNVSAEISQEKIEGLQAKINNSRTQAKSQNALLKTIEILLKDKDLPYQVDLFEEQLKQHFGKGVTVLPGYTETIEYLQTMPKESDAKDKFKIHLSIFCENLRAIQRSKLELGEVLFNFKEDIMQSVESKAQALQRLAHDKNLTDEFKKHCALAILLNPALIPVETSLVRAQLKEAQIKVLFPNDKLSEITFKQRMEVLNYLRKMAVENLKANNLQSPKILIVGAGPAGLSRAILAALAGCEIQVLEKREEQREGRPNVLVLGKDSDHERTLHDMQMLEFLGVKTLLEDENKWGNFPLNADARTTKIDDLEIALKMVIKELGLGDRITYEKTVTGVGRSNQKIGFVIGNAGKQEGASAKLSIDDSQQGEYADLVLLADGARAETAHLLGIERLALADQSEILISTFSRSAKKIVSKAQNIFKILSNVSEISQKYKGLKIQDNPSEQFETLEHQLLFRVPNMDYLIKGLTQEEELDPLYQRLKKLQRLEKKILKLEKDDDKLQQLQEKEKQLRKKCISNLETIAENGKALFDAQHLIDEKKISDLLFSKALLISVGINRSLVAAAQVGDIPVLLCGDALQDIDPIAGVGAKYALESIPCFANALTNLFRSKKQPISLILKQYELSSHFFREKALAETFEKRSYYKPNTELLARHIELAAGIPDILQKNLDDLYIVLERLQRWTRLQERKDLSEFTPKFFIAKHEKQLLDFFHETIETILKESPDMKTSIVIDVRMKHASLNILLKLVTQALTEGVVE